MLTVVGVMGSGRDPGPKVLAQAEEIGRLIAGRGWVLLNGGRNAGVMDASARGAAQAGGLVVGVLPDEDLSNASPHLSIAIRTGLGHARNVVNVLSSDVVIALAGGAGTLTEVAHALQAGRTVICLDFEPGPTLAEYEGVQLLRATSAREAIELAAWALDRSAGAGPSGGN
jgi:uncharacterized protein (TIGR00725 family)